MRSIRLKKRHFFKKPDCDTGINGNLLIDRISDVETIVQIVFLIRLPIQNSDLWQYSPFSVSDSFAL